MAAACESPAALKPPVLPGPPVKILVQPESLGLRQDTSRQLTVVVLDAAGDTLKAPPLLFTALDTSIVHVSPLGDVTATGKQGSTVILLGCDTVRVLLPVHIVPVPSAIVAVPITVDLGLGGYYPIRSQLRDKYGQIIPGATGTLVPYSPDVTVVDSVFLHAGNTTGLSATLVTYHDSLVSLVDTVAVFIGQYGLPQGGVIDSIPSGEEYGVAVGPTFALATTATIGGPLLRLTFPARAFESEIGSAGGLGVTFDSMATRAYVAGTGNGVTQGGVNVVDLTSGTLVTTVLAHVIGDPRDVIVSPDGQRVYVAVTTARIYVISTASNSVVDSIMIPSLANHFSLDQSGHWLYASLDAGRVMEVSLDSNKVTRLFPDSGTIPQPQGTAVSLDGTEHYTVTASDLFVFNRSTGQQVAEVPGLGGFGLAISPDPHFLFVTDSGTVKVVDLVNRFLHNRFVVGGTARRVAVSRDGGALLVANANGWLSVIY